MLVDRFHNLYVAYSGFYEPEDVLVDETKIQQLAAAENVAEPSGDASANAVNADVQASSSNTTPQGFDMVSTNRNITLTQFEFGVLCALAGVGATMIFMKLAKRKSP
jgi:hypothetical protein